MKIGLDVDDVLAAFYPYACTFYNKPTKKLHYWDEVVMDKHLQPKWFTEGIAPNREFWRDIPTYSLPKDIDFDFDCYISSFPIEMYDIRVEWLKKNGFPDKPLVVSNNKVHTCQELGIDLLVDDKPQTARLFKDHGMNCLHFITTYAGFEPVGNYITNLNQVKNYL